MFERSEELHQLLDRLLPSLSQREHLDQFIERVAKIPEIEKITFSVVRERGRRLPMPTIIVVSSVERSPNFRLITLLAGEYGGGFGQVDIGRMFKDKYPKDSPDIILWERSAGKIS